MGETTFPVKNGNLVALPTDPQEGRRALGDDERDDALDPNIWDLQPTDVEVSNRGESSGSSSGVGGNFAAPDQEGQDVQDPGIDDYWDLRPLTLVRVHNRRRMAMFAPDRCHDPPPVPLNHIDVTRITKTDLENHDEKSIEDVWGGTSSDVRKLSGQWRG